MSGEFDASLVWSDPVSTEVSAAQERTVGDLMLRPNALINAKLHAERELERLIMACSKAAWGTVYADRREPTAPEVAELLGRIEGEDREKLLENARLAAEQRQLVAAMQDAETRYLAEFQAEQEQLAAQQAERLEWEEFEAFDAAGQAERFAAWRAARQ
jgi:hypothetical protein